MAEADEMDYASEDSEYQASELNEEEEEACKNANFTNHEAMVFKGVRSDSY